ncbi:MAG: hypothetical protein GF331_01245, partial [Chitinivibrionales bacterium]|nr:hypothetical protein [Chitinivibrionales bacterium]
MRSLYPCVLIAGLCLLGGLSCSEDNPTTAEDTQSVPLIAGKVLQVESGATVSLEQGRPVYSTVVDPADGYFVLQDVQPGVYRLRIVADGYDTFTTIILVEAGMSYEFGNVVLAELTADFDDSIPSVYDHYPKKSAEIIYTPPDQYNEGSERLF